MTDENYATRPGSEPNNTSIRWTIGIACLGIALGMTSFFLLLNGHRPPVDAFWEIDEDAWLGFVGSILSAGIAGAVAGWVLRKQLDKQDEHLTKQLEAQAASAAEDAAIQQNLQRQALNVQREESRRTREIDALIELIPYIRQHAIPRDNDFIKNRRLKYESLAFRWEMNSRLTPEQATKVTNDFLALFNLITYGELHEDGGYFMTDYDSEASQDLPYFDSAVTESLRDSVTVLVQEWMRIPYASDKELHQWTKAIEATVPNYSQQMKAEGRV